MRVTRDCAIGKWAGLTLTDPLWEITLIDCEKTKIARHLHTDHGRCLPTRMDHSINTSLFCFYRLGCTCSCKCNALFRFYI